MRRECTYDKAKEGKCCILEKSIGRWHGRHSGSALRSTIDPGVEDGTKYLDEEWWLSQGAAGVVKARVFGRLWFYHEYFYYYRRTYGNLEASPLDLNTNLER